MVNISYTFNYLEVIILVNSILNNDNTKKNVYWIIV